MISMSDPLQVQALDTLIRETLPADLVSQAALLIGTTVHADWTGLLTALPGTYSYQVVHHHPDLPVALLSYLEQRTRSFTPLAREAFQHTRPVFVDTYANHPDAQHGAVALGISSVAHLPLGHQAAETYIMTVMRATSSPTLARGAPWTEDERTFMETASRSVQEALASNTR